MGKKIELQYVAQLVIQDAKDRETVCGILAKNGQWATVGKRYKVRADGSASKNLEYVVSVAVPVDGEGDRE